MPTRHLVSNNVFLVWEIMAADQLRIYISYPCRHAPLYCPMLILACLTGVSGQWYIYMLCVHCSKRVNINICDTIITMTAKTVPRACLFKNNNNNLIMIQAVKRPAKADSRCFSFSCHHWGCELEPLLLRVCPAPSAGRRLYCRDLWENFRAVDTPTPATSPAAQTVGLTIDLSFLQWCGHYNDQQLNVHQHPLVSGPRMRNIFCETVSVTKVTMRWHPMKEDS